ncbi:hypothetical protein AX16_006923 [Volvariella volvacea WC 439]|nr:hypothetical protein AX16_006923 [Volvariella volvacea WC 439]
MAHKHGDAKAPVLFEDQSTDEKGGESPLDVSEAEQRQVLTKMDWNIVPFVSLLYLLSFLDRTNIGNARIAGMTEDAELYGLRYNIIAAAFFIPYALFEVPSNIALKLIRPSRWIPSIMVAWGLVMTFMCFCHNYEGLLAARVFLGITEAGLFPGVTFYLSLWYRRRDVTARISLFFSAATPAGAFGGILAYGIERMDGLGGLHGWQWIFCIEGIVTVLVAFIAFFYMHDYPETARFLNDRERVILVNMLKEDQQGLATHYEHKFVWQAMTDYKTYVQVAIYIGLLVPVYAVALFTPTIVRALGYSAADAQLMSTPLFVAGCIATIAAGIASDRLNLRGPFVVGPALISLIGYIILYTQTRPGVAYAGAILAALGIYPAIPIAVTWAGSMAGGDVRKGVVLAMVRYGKPGRYLLLVHIFRPPSLPRWACNHDGILVSRVRDLPAFGTNRLLQRLSSQHRL